MFTLTVSLGKGVTPQTNSMFLTQGFLWIYILKCFFFFIAHSQILHFICTIQNTSLCKAFWISLFANVLSARVLSTAGVEIPQETVLREQLLLWMVHNTVSPSPAHLYVIWYCHNNLKLCLTLLIGLAVASGLAATLTITHLFKAGDGILCMNDVYGGELLLLIINKMIVGFKKKAVKSWYSYWDCNVLSTRN